MPLFLIKIRSWDVLGQEPLVRCRVKMWHVWVWDSLVGQSMKMERFNDEWNWISGLFGIQKPWRFVIGGRTINPEWALGGFIEPQTDGTGLLTVRMILDQ